MNLPKGFVLDGGGAAANVTLPSGFVLDAPRTGASGEWDAPDGAPARFAKSAWDVVNPMNVIDAIAHPMETARGLLDTRKQAQEAMQSAAMAIPGGRMEPSVMDPNSRLDYAAHAARKAIESVPIIGPIVGGLADTITGKLEEDDYAGAAGALTGVAGLALAPKVARPAGETTARMVNAAEARQVARYGRTMSPEAPLTETMSRKMMDAGIKDPKAAASGSPARVSALETEAAALDAAREALPQARGVNAKARATQAHGLETKRGGVVDQIAFERNLQKIAEALPTEKSAGNILIEGVAKRGVKYGAAGAAVSIASDAITGGMATFGAGAVTALQTLNEIRKTRAYQASSAIAKRRFAEALAKKDLGTAAAAGAEIMSGAALADDFGHAAAVNSLLTQTEPLGSPDLRRQVVASQRAFYVQPDGSRIEIPRNVMTALANTRNASAIESPISGYLAAMAKSGAIKRGGRVVFAGDAISAAPQAGFDGHEWPVDPDRAKIFRDPNAPDISKRAGLLIPPGFSGPSSVQYEQADEALQKRNNAPTEHTPESRPDAFTEEEARTWPQIELALSENSGWLEKVQPAHILPEHLKTVRSARIAVPLPAFQKQIMRDASGVYGSTPLESPNITFEQYYKKYGESPNTALIAPHEGTMTLYHELGHAVTGDLTEGQIESWERHYEHTLTAARAVTKHMYVEESQIADPPEGRDESIAEEDRRIGKHGPAADRLRRVLNQVVPLWLRTGTHSAMGSDVNLYENSSGEALAEAFSWYINAPSLLRRVDPSTYGWLNKNVFRGREYIRPR